MDQPIRHLTVTCHNCGSPAAQFTLLPAGTGPSEDRFRDRGRLIRSGFLGEVTMLTEWEGLERLFEALTEKRLGEANRLDPDALGFYCPACDAPYCQGCWHIGPPLFDEDFQGFYDRTEGVCPYGHTRTVDD